MPKAREILLADADVLIDYLGSDLTVLELTSTKIGELYILRQVLATVRGLTERDCRRYRIQALDAEMDALLEAGTMSGPLSFEDWLCLITCRERSWTCVTNDRALTRECGREGIRVRRGLGLMVELVRFGVLDERRALLVAEAIHKANPYHINDRVLEHFRQTLRQH